MAKRAMDRALKRQQISKRQQRQHIYYLVAAAGSSLSGACRKLQRVSFSFSADSPTYTLFQHPLGPSERDMWCSIFIVPLVVLGRRWEGAESRSATLLNKSGRHKAGALDRFLNIFLYPDCCCYQLTARAGVTKVTQVTPPPQACSEN